MKPSKLSKAMILAAGFGTRLNPLTLTMPKALVKVNGIPMIKSLVDRLISFGINEITINTHHLHEQIYEFFKQNEFEAKVNLIYEEEILGTGGGIKNAYKFLSNSNHFIVHNTDVLSDFDLTRMYEYHILNNSFATLAVMKRKTERPLLFTKNGQLAGRIRNNSNEIILTNSGELHELAFCGITIFDSQIFEFFPSEENFDIVPGLLDLSRMDKSVLAYNPGNIFWKDLGKPENIA